MWTVLCVVLVHSYQNRDIPRVTNIFCKSLINTRSTCTGSLPRFLWYGRANFLPVFGKRWAVGFLFLNFSYDHQRYREPLAGWSALGVKIKLNINVSNLEECGLISERNLFPACLAIRACNSYMSYSKNYDRAERWNLKMHFNRANNLLCVES